MNHNEINDCLEAYALGALDEPQLNEVRDHVASCEACRIEVDRFEQVVAALPEALAVASPVPPSDVAAQRIRRVIRRREQRSRIATIVAAVAIVLLVIAAGWIVRSERTLADAQDRNERLITETEFVYEVLDSPEGHDRTVLRAETEGADWYGKVFTAPNLPYIAVMAGQLPEPEDGTDYHVWLTFEDGTTTLAGVLQPNDNGFAPLVHTARTDGPVITDVVVTAERPGATEPTGPPVLAASDA